MSTDELPFRILPRVTDRNAHYWQGGRDGRLHVQRCNACGYRVHPPGVLCPRCHSKDLGVGALSGRGTVLTFTVNHQRWMPGLEPPFVLAVIGLEEQDDLRVTSNVVHCDPESVRIGMPVQVTFEARPDDEVWIPLFEPRGDDA